MPPENKPFKQVDFQLDCQIRLAVLSQLHNLMFNHSVATNQQRCDV